MDLVPIPNKINAALMHKSGINQIFVLDCTGDLVSIDDDCLLVFWERFKPVHKVVVETMTCITRVGKNYLVGGSHSGNIQVVNIKTKKISVVE